jgi:hypothetical protein
MVLMKLEQGRLGMQRSGRVKTLAWQLNKENCRGRTMHRTPVMASNSLQAIKAQRHAYMAQ